MINCHTVGIFNVDGDCVNVDKLIVVSGGGRVKLASYIINCT